MGFSLLIKPKKPRTIKGSDQEVVRPQSYPPIQIINSPTFNNNPQFQQHLTNNRYDAVRDTPTPKPRKRSNLQPPKIEYRTLFLSENDIFWEAKESDEMIPYHCAVLRFCNKAVAGQAGQSIEGLRASLQVRGTDEHEYAPIDRGAWVRERYNSIDLAVGSCRMLVIVWRTVPGTKAFAFAPADNHYSDKVYDRAYFMKLDHLPAEVDVSLIAGDGGYVMYEGTYRVDIEPDLRLTEIKSQTEHG